MPWYRAGEKLRIKDGDIWETGIYIQRKMTEHIAGGHGTAVNCSICWKIGSLVLMVSQ